MPSASALCTRVRAAVVFWKINSKKRFSCEHVCKLSRFFCRLLTLSRVLQCILKTLQNRSEKLKSTTWSKQNWLSVDVYSGFWKVHTESTTKPQTFELEHVRGPIHSTKTEVRMNTCHQTRRRVRFWAKNALNASRAGGHALNLGKQSVWAKSEPGVADSKTALHGQGTLTQRGSDDG